MPSLPHIRTLTHTHTLAYLVLCSTKTILYCHTLFCGFFPTSIMSQNTKKYASFSVQLAALNEVNVWTVLSIPLGSIFYCAKKWN